LAAFALFLTVFEIQRQNKWAYVDFSWRLKLLPSHKKLRNVLGERKNARGACANVEIGLNPVRYHLRVQCEPHLNNRGVTL